MLRNSRTDLYTLNFLLFGLFIPFQLVSFVLMPSVVDDSDDRGHRRGRNQDQVETLLFGNRQRLARLHDANLSTILSHHANVARYSENSLVDWGPWFGPDVSPKARYFSTPRFS